MYVTSSAPSLTDIAPVLDAPMQLRFAARAEGRSFTHDDLTLSYALAYASLGLWVLPLHGVDDQGCTCRGRSQGCNPGKHPSTPNGVHDATNDPDAIRDLLSSRPGANLGLALGRSGLWVLDLDDRFERGYSGWHTLTDLEPFIGSTLTHSSLTVSSGAGLHGYFLVTSEAPPTAIGVPGVDVLQGDVYVVVPPSRHVRGGEYVWINRSDPEPAPGGLLTALRWLQGQTRSASPLQSPLSPTVIRSPARTSSPVTMRRGDRFQFLSQRNGSSPYGKAVLERTVTRLEGTNLGSIHATLRTSALVCGSYVAGGELLETEAVSAVLDALDRMHQRNATMDLPKAQALLTWGLAEGKKTPKKAPPSPLEPWQAAALRSPSLLLEKVSPSAPARDLRAINVLVRAAIEARTPEVELSMRDLAYNLGSPIGTAHKTLQALQSAGLLTVGSGRRTAVSGKAAWACQHLDLSPLRETVQLELARDEHMVKGWGGGSMCSSQPNPRHDAFTGPRGALRWLVLATATGAPLQAEALVFGRQSLPLVTKTINELTQTGHLRAEPDGSVRSTGADLNELATDLGTTGEIDRRARQFHREREAEAGYLRTGRSSPTDRASGVLDGASQPPSETSERPTLNTASEGDDHPG